MYSTSTLVDPERGLHVPRPDALLERREGKRHLGHGAGLALVVAEPDVGQLLVLLALVLEAVVLGPEGVVTRRRAANRWTSFMMARQLKLLDWTM